MNDCQVNPIAVCSEAVADIYGASFKHFVQYLRETFDVLLDGHGIWIQGNFIKYL